MAPFDRAALAGRAVLRLVAEIRAEKPASVPQDAFVSVAQTRSEASSVDESRLKRRHVLMLALAFEVLLFGFRNADRYQPPGITVEQTVAHGHIIT